MGILRLHVFEMRYIYCTGGNCSSNFSASNKRQARERGWVKDEDGWLCPKHASKARLVGNRQR